MRIDDPGRDGSAFPVGPAGQAAGPSRLSRRQVFGTMSAAATAGAVAWVVPEILTAKPAAGAVLSTPGGGGGGGGGGGIGVGVGVGVGVGDGPDKGSGGKGDKGSSVQGQSGAVGPGTVLPLAGRGREIARAAELGTAMAAGGWAFHRWASRNAESAVVEAGEGQVVRESGNRG